MQSELEPSLYILTVPPAPVLEKLVTILFELTFLKPLAGALMALAMNVTLPVVLTVRFVNVLLLMFCDRIGKSKPAVVEC